MTAEPAFAGDGDAEPRYRQGAQERKHDGLGAIVAGSPTEELPRLIGDLEAAKAAAWARLATARGPSAASGASDRLLTMPRAAERLGITEHQAREMGRRGELPVVHVGERHVRVSARALEEWIKRRAQARLAEPGRR